MATTIKFKVIKGANKITFVDVDGKTKHLRDHEVSIDGKYVGNRVVHTGNSNMLYVKEIEKETVWFTVNGMKQSRIESTTKDKAVFHPIAKISRRVLHAIR